MIIIRLSKFKFNNITLEYRSVVDVMKCYITDLLYGGVDIFATINMKPLQIKLLKES